MTTEPQPPPTKIRRRLRTPFAMRHLVALFVLSFALWILGFVVFVAHIETLSEPDTSVATPTDAIVVLTGGSERLATGVALLNQHLGKKLFVSGVHQGLSLDHVAGLPSVDPDLRACCIILGYAAESTWGNAEETQMWMTLEDYHSLRLVTANYHMPRSLLIFRKTMPDLTIVPHPIAPDSVKLDMWWTRAGTTDLLLTEYVKYILTFLRLKVA